MTPASLLFPSDYASNTPPSPDVISSTPKASVTSSAIQLSSRSKGLSKTVSLLVCKSKHFIQPHHLCQQTLLQHSDVSFNFQEVYHRMKSVKILHSHVNFYFCNCTESDTLHKILYNNVHYEIHY